MRHSVSEPPSNVVFLGWQGNRCLKRFDAVPEVMGAGDNGAALFLLANAQSYFQLQPGSEAYAANHQRLASAAVDRRKVMVTVDIATNDILIVV